MLNKFVRSFDFLFILTLIGAIGWNFIPITVFVKKDPGGYVQSYMDRVVSYRQQGITVAIDGPCASACTLFTRLSSTGQICATTRGVLLFHQSYIPHPDGSKEIINQGLDGLYPIDVLRELDKHGGLDSLEGDEMIVIPATNLIPKCGILANLKSIIL